jgi:hypothetical protein
MPERLVDPLDLLLKAFVGPDGAALPGISLVPLPSPCQAVIVRYAPGTLVPRHEHTSPILTVVLRGTLHSPDGTWGPGALIECAGPYGPRTTHEEVLLLVIQPVGARYVPVDEPRE